MTTPHPTPFVICQRVVKVYRVAEHELVALRGIDFSLQRGELACIIGPSGAGKSSLLNLIGALDTPTAGQVLVSDTGLNGLNRAALAEYRLRRVGFIWQQIQKNLFGHLTALENVILPMRLARRPAQTRRPHALELLDAVGMAEHAEKYPGQLSGGQAQRVALAVALANEPPLLLADEPTGALDRRAADQVMALLVRLREQTGLTILMVTHDLDVAAHADRVLTLRDGALGQDVDQEDAAPILLDAEGQVRLPRMARTALSVPGRDGEQQIRIAMEIRPEGVLLRPMTEDDAPAIAAPVNAALPRKRGRR